MTKSIFVNDYLTNEEYVLHYEYYKRYVSPQICTKIKYIKFEMYAKTYEYQNFFQNLLDLHRNAINRN